MESLMEAAKAQNWAVEPQEKKLNEKCLYYIFFGHQQNKFIKH
jgi:hypothetical protein